MNGWEFLYLIGYGIAFIMTFYAASEENREMPEEEQCFGGVISVSLICAVFSWAIPIWWIGFKIYKRSGEK